jgi:predicted HicB family RNase H-like nuclease
MATTAMIDEIMKQPYVRLIIPDKETGTFTGEIMEFDGCRTQGDTIDQTYRELEAVAREWLAAVIDAGQSIPSPAATAGYSGRLALRLPKSLHKQAARYAERDGVSLNQFIVTALAVKVGAVAATNQLQLLASFSPWIVMTPLRLVATAGARSLSFVKSNWTGETVGTKVMKSNKLALSV